jgi:hypothetical protein
MKTVWIYFNTAVQPGDGDYLEVFVTEAAAHRWLAETKDPNNVAYEYPVHGSVSNDDPFASKLSNRHSGVRGRKRIDAANIKRRSVKS